MQAATPINIVTGDYEFPCLIIIDDEEWWDRYGHQVEANWETLRIRRYSSLDTAGLAALATDPTWSNEGLFAFLEGLRRLAVIDIAGRTAAPAVEVEFWMADNWHIGNAATDGEDFRGGSSATSSTATPPPSAPPRTSRSSGASTQPARSVPAGRVRSIVQQY